MGGFGFVNLYLLSGKLLNLFLCVKRGFDGGLEIIKSVFMLDLVELFLMSLEELSDLFFEFIYLSVFVFELFDGFGLFLILLN